MKIETLIYAYLAICAAMIVFNLVCIFIFRRREKKITKRSKDFTERITNQINSCESDPEAEPDASFRKYLAKKLRHVNHLMAFDEALDALYAENPEVIKRFLESLTPVFIYLTLEYRKKNALKAAYFPYMIKKYGVFRGKNIAVISDIMLDLVKEPSLYCRENALQVLYSIGNSEGVLSALAILDSGTRYHHHKLITDGLLNFAGDSEKLGELLWQKLSDFSVPMRVAILNYFRFSSSRHCAAMLRLMTEPQQNDEVCYSCIRYFGKYPYEPAFPYLLDYVGNEDSENWEYAAIAASALALYPSKKTEELLIEKLSSPNWYVRFNAAKSLELLGLDYTQLIDVFEGEDRYAGEMMRYRFDRKKLREEEKMHSHESIPV